MPEQWVAWVRCHRCFAPHVVGSDTYTYLGTPVTSGKVPGLINAPVCADGCKSQLDDQSSVSALPS